MSRKRIKHIFILVSAILATLVLLDLFINGVSVDKKENTLSVSSENTILTETVSELFFAKPKGVVSSDIVRNVPPPKEEILPFWITDDPTLLIGEGFFYVEDGILYRNKIKDGVVVERGQKITEGGERLLMRAQDGKTALFTIKSEQSRTSSGEIWAIDKELGTVRKIYEDVYYAQISPDGEIIAVSQRSTGELHLIDRYGNLLNKVGTHGGSATFSDSGENIAYYKFADYAEGGNFHDYLEGSYGIAIYDRQTGAEQLIVSRHGNEDYFPIGFSADDSHFYFVSDHEGEKFGLWSVGFDAEEKPILLTSITTSVFINKDNAIWSSDRSSIISATDEISLVHISADGQSAQVYDIGKGTAPRWKVQDKVIEFKGPDGWEEVDISSFLNNE